MSITADAAGPQYTAQRGSRLPRPSLIVCVFLALLAGLAFGGYVLHWSWVGLNGDTATLWQWLNLVGFPLAFAVVPILYLRRSALRLPGTPVLLAAAGVAGLFVLASYEVPLTWTGFPGNTLWDWLKLMLPPLAVVSVACAGSVRSTLLADHGVRLAVILVALAVAVVGGYVGGWAWTGFAHQTAWDWLRLLLLPLAIPTVVSPALTAVAREMVLRAAVRGPAHADADADTDPEPAAPGH
jgi:hypothetical protein